MTRSMNGPRWAFQGQGELPHGVGDHVGSAAVDALGGAASFARRGSVGDPRGTRSPERQCRPRPANVLPRGRCVCPCQSELLVSVAAHSAATARRAQRARFFHRPAGLGGLTYQPAPPVPAQGRFPEVVSALTTGRCEIGRPVVHRPPLFAQVRAGVGHLRPVAPRRATAPPRRHRADGRYSPVGRPVPERRAEVLRPGPAGARRTERHRAAHADAASTRPWPRRSRRCGRRDRRRRPSG